MKKVRFLFITWMILGLACHPQERIGNEFTHQVTTSHARLQLTTGKVIKDSLALVGLAILSSQAGSVDQVTLTLVSKGRRIAPERSVRVSDTLFHFWVRPRFAGTNRLLIRLEHVAASEQTSVPLRVLSAP